MDASGCKSSFKRHCIHWLASQARQGHLPCSKRAVHGVGMVFNMQGSYVPSVVCCTDSTSMCKQIKAISWSIEMLVHL